MNFLLVPRTSTGCTRRRNRRLVECTAHPPRECFAAATPSTRGPRGQPPAVSPCGSPLRPDVVWFGEALPQGAIEAAAEAARGCDVFLSVGTSGLVEPAASLPFVALEQGAQVIEVNPAKTPLTRRASFVLAGPAGEVLPRLA